VPPGIPTLPAGLAGVEESSTDIDAEPALQG
jgi:hypothetical protein